MISTTTNVSLPIEMASQIEEHGIGHVFGIPGSGPSLILVDALERRGVAFHTVQHEAAAAVMAGTLGRLTGKAGVAISIKGPGLANMAAGMALCHLESFPMVAIADGVTPGTPMFRAHKRMDHGALVAACSKRHLLPGGGQDFLEAATSAEQESPAPVLLELLDQPCSDASLESEMPNETSPPPAIPRVIEECQRPVVIAGTLAIRLGMSGLLNELSAPVFSTTAAKGVVNEALPHAAGVCTGAGLELTLEKKIIQQADLIVTIGLRAREMLGVAAFGANVIAIDAQSDEGNAVWQFSSLLPSQMAHDILFLLKGKSWGQDEIASSQGTLYARMRGDSFLPAHVFSILENYFGERSRTILDTGNFCTVGEHICIARTPNDVLLSGQGRYMGVSIGMGIASAINSPDRPTVVIVGDGGIGPHASELRLAVAEKLPILIILMSDGGFGSIRGSALKNGLGIKPLTPKNPSWLGVMEGLGMRVHEARDENAFVRALSKWSPEDGPAYVEVHFQPEAYDRMLDGVR